MNKHTHILYIFLVNSLYILGEFFIYSWLCKEYIYLNLPRLSDVQLLEDHCFVLSLSKIGQRHTRAGLLKLMKGRPKYCNGVYEEEAREACTSAMSHVW